MSICIMGISMYMLSFDLIFVCYPIRVVRNLEFVEYHESWKALMSLWNGWLFQKEFVIVCHEKVVRIPLEERESETKTSKSNVHDYQSLVKVVKDKILATLSQTSKVENAPAEMLCKTNVVIDALRRKERVKPRRVRAMAMTIQYGFDWPELVSRTTDKVVLVGIKEKLKSVRDCQKSYADNRSKPLEFEVGDQVMLKVSPCKGVVGFGKKGKLAPISESLVSRTSGLEAMFPLIRKKFRWGTIFPIRLKRYSDPKEEPFEKEPLMELKEIG
ncbi:hypothetical protein Tco_1370649 [Tanacetum coccineum]